MNKTDLEMLAMIVSRCDESMTRIVETLESIDRAQERIAELLGGDEDE